jgi:hypothetical protein
MKPKHILAGAAVAICLLLLVADRAPARPGAIPANGTLFAQLQPQVPAGFLPARPPQVYGTTERPLQDGTIFNFMDGGGVAYLEHGFVELYHAEFADSAKNEITLDVFVMGSPAQAKEALADERICPAGGSPPVFAPQGKAYRFPPDYFIYFSANDRLVYLHINNDLQGDALDRFAARVVPIIEKEKP